MRVGTDEDPLWIRITSLGLIAPKDCSFGGGYHHVGTLGRSGEVDKVDEESSLMQVYAEPTYFTK